MKHSFKTILFSISTLFLTTAICRNAPAPKEPPLKHKLLHVIDGMGGALDGDGIDDLIIIVRDIIKLQFGEGKSRTGLFEFEGKKHTIRSLSQIEMHEFENFSEEQRREFTELLEKVKKDFITIMHPFFEKARGTKKLTLELIGVWAEVRNRHDSLLFSWGSQEEGSEAQAFQQTISSFHQLDKFCSDLVSFLDDLINSCPRGMNQYHNLKRKHE